MNKALTVRFAAAAELLGQESHLAHGAFFVPGPEPEPEPLAELTLCVDAPFGQAEVGVRVIQVIPGSGVALAFIDPEAGKAALEPLLAAARDQDPGAGGPVEVVWGRPDPAPEADEAGEDPTEDEQPDTVGDEVEEPSGTLYDQIRAMSSNEKMRLAKNGDRASRLILMKDTNKTIHTFVIKNPRITIDEVRYMATNRQCNPEALQQIAANRDWIQNPRVVAALVRNPKTPPAIARRLLDKLPMSELRQLAKSPSVPKAVSMAAKRKVSG